MREKTYTILLSSNRKGTTRAVTVSSAWIKACVVFGGILAVVASAASLDYVGLLLQTTENKRLKAESEQLKRQFRMVESKLVTLEKSLDRVQNFSRKLKLITNIEDDDRSLKLSVSSGSFAQGINFYEESKREPLNAKSFKSDSLFLEKAPLDISNGELSQEAVRGYAILSIRIDESVQNTELTEQSVLQLYDQLSERQSLLTATPSIKPTRGWFTSQFGYRLDPFTGKPQMHNGIDMAASPGTPVYAPASGIISYVGYEQGYGKIVSIDHGFGVVTRYAHNSQTFVEVGQKVKRRDVISAVGSTGRSSGPHLHYEVRIHGLPVDPKNYILTE